MIGKIYIIISHLTLVSGTMNEKDIEIAKKVAEEINGVGNSDSIVFDTNFTQIGKTNLLLLKGLLDIENKNGFFVVLDRPHQYMSYLLSMHDVSQENIWFIDGVTHQSGGKEEAKQNVNFLEGPFHIENLLDNIEYNIKQSKGEFPSPEKIDFFLIDNIAAMLNYNSIDNIESFIESFSDFIDRYQHVMGGMTVDKESYPELTELLLEYFGFIIDIEETKKEVGR